MPHVRVSQGLEEVELMLSPTTKPGLVVPDKIRWITMRSLMAQMIGTYTGSRHARQRHLVKVKWVFYNKGGLVTQSYHRSDQSVHLSAPNTNSNDVFSVIYMALFTLMSCI